MTKEELRAIRESMHYSMADFGILLGIPKSTLQRYEDGSAVIKQDLVDKVMKEKSRDADFMERTRQETREWCDRFFPLGIPANFKGRL